jgi:phosphohistidine swiveling domain-containing protein
MIGSAPAELDIPFIPFSPLAVLWKVLPGMFKARQSASRDAKQMPEFIATMPDLCRTTRATIQRCRDASSLLSLWKESIKPAVVRACGLLRSVTMALSDPATKLRLDLIALIGEADANAILSNLSGPSGNLASLGPLLGLAQAADGKMSRETYLERYGHRGPHEMELFAPGSDDDPAWFEKQLADFTRLPVDVEALLANQRQAWENAWKRMQARHPREAHRFQKRLNVVAASAQNREAVRSEVTRVARLVRSFLLRVGEVTGLGDDVFFLSLDEMTDVLAGGKSSVTRIPARRETYLKYCAQLPYPAIIIGKFDPFKWAADPNRRSDYFDSRTSVTSIGNIIKGFAGAAGCVDGIVRRIDRMEDGYQIQAGEILVTVTTNVGWTPLFPRLAAIITDVGAPLSHAAIVARELGIPAVVGCGNATMRLKTGDRVRVDGGAGIVELK